MFAVACPRLHRCSCIDRSSMSQSTVVNVTRDLNDKEQHDTDITRKNCRSFEDRGQTEGLTALPRPYSLDIDL